MRPCFHVEIVTPKKVVLNGLLFGPRTASMVFIFLHGLTGSAFSMRALNEALVSRDSAVLTFNNRGFEQISSVKQRSGSKTKYLLSGTTHERFHDSFDDVQAAVNSARAAGFKRVYLVGHSTGCNKAIYWAAKGGKGVRALILLGPLSDYSGALAAKGKKSLAKGLAHARKLVAAGTPHALMPRELGEWFACDAQRFLSLYSPDSDEEIFTYARPAVKPKTVRKVEIPILVLLAGSDEYGDRAPGEIADWFLEHLYTGESVIVPGVNHSFKGAEKLVAKEIRSFADEF